MGMLEIFRISGRIACEYSDAQRGIENVSGCADTAAESIENLGDEAGETQESVAGLGDEAERTSESTGGLGDETERTGEQVEDTNEDFSTWKTTLTDLAKKVIQKATDKVTELAKEIVGLGEDFTSTMSEVKAISGASDEDFQKLTDTAREFGSKTVFSATEAAEALKYMSLAGWDAEQSSAALGGVLDLAAASGMGLGDASDMVTDYLSAFGMEAKDSAYFADMLAYAQANSNTTATQLGEAYGNCGATLHAAGQDIETVTSFLEAMANQGLKGSEAGTALNATMRDITNAMSTVKDETDLAQLSQNELVSSTGDLNDLLGKNYIQMGKTLIPVSDANGNFRDLTDILTDVSKATDGMGDAEKAAAMSSTFTSYSIKGVNLILNEGIDKVSKYEDALRQADGSASDMASTMNDNLKGDLAGMNSALEELKLKIYDGLEGPLRNAVQTVTGKVVPALTALMQNFDSILPGLAALTTAIVTFKTVMAISGIINTVTTAWTAYKAANEGATVAQWLFNAAVGANPLVLLISLLAALVVGFVVAYKKVDWFREAVDNLASGFVNGWSDFANWWTDIVVGLIDGFKNGWSDFANWWTDKAKKTWTNIKSAFGKVGEFFGGIWNTIKSKFTSIGTKIGEAIGGAFKNAINSVIATVENGINFIPNSINKALDLINKLPNVEISAIPTIELPRLAKGGVVNEDSVVEVGEDGSEAIVPLEHNTEWTSRVASLINSRIPYQGDNKLLSKLDEIISLMKNNRDGNGAINFTLKIDNFNNTANTSVNDLSETITTTLYELIKREKLGAV